MDLSSVLSGSALVAALAAVLGVALRLGRLEAVASPEVLQRLQTLETLLEQVMPEDCKVRLQVLEGIVAQLGKTDERHDATDRVSAADHRELVDEVGWLRTVVAQIQGRCAANHGEFTGPILLKPLGGRK